MELKIKDLYKSYDHGKTYAINDVSADLSPGIYGILGPNGAGKSTMFGTVSYTHLLMTDLRAGAVKCFGQSVLLQTEDENRKDRSCLLYTSRCV